MHSTITAMTTSAIILIIVAVLAAAAYAVYLSAMLRGDGFDLARRRPPASHPRDLFEPTIGPGGSI